MAHRFPASAFSDACPLPLVLQVVPGATVPTDGNLVWGASSINEAMITGESLPVNKAPGDEVSCAAAAVIMCMRIAA